MMNRHLSKWARHWQRVKRNRRTWRELDAFSAAERGRVADDVGLSGSDLRRFSCTHEGPNESMPARLRQLGIDPDYVKVALTATYRDLERVCATCRSSQRCARDLAMGDAQSGMQNYCLNAPTIDCLIVDQPERLPR